jgi:hypothetical protein
MSPPFDLTDWSTAGQGNTLVGDAAVLTCAAFGATGFWHKATEGVSYKDPAFRRRRAAARSYRYSGMYHWLSPGKPLDRQLGNFQDAVGDLYPGEGIQLDSEQAGLDAAFIATAWEYWAAAYGEKRVGVYTGRYFTGGTSRTPVIDDLPAYIEWWLAWYGPGAYSLITARLPRVPFVWQWGGGKEGVQIPMLRNARVDSNQIILPAALDAFCGLDGPAPPPVPAPAPVPQPFPPPISTPWALVPEEDDMPVRIGPLLIQATGADGSPPGTVYLSDGRGMAGYPAEAIDGPPTPVDRVSAFGHVVNP